MDRTYMKRDDNQVDGFLLLDSLYFFLNWSLFFIHSNRDTEIHILSV